MRPRPVVLSRGAEADIDAIAAYTKERWGSIQADIYLAKLEEGLNVLAQTPSAGRRCDFLRPGLRRFEIESHVVFYRVDEAEVGVVRILHQRMLPVQSRFEP